MKVKIFACAAIFTLVVMLSQEAFANNAEDQIVGIIERILDVIANFLDRIFQSIADAVKSVWTPSKD